MSSKFQHDEELLESRGFGLTLGFGRKPALVVIDLFYAFTDPLFDLGSDLDSVIAATNLLLDASHAANVPVIFTRVVYEEHDLADGGIWVRKQRGCLALWPGTRAAELDGRLHRAARDAVLFKKFASCFFGTSLVSRLVQHGIDTLVMSGCSTSGCVRATAVDACQYGFRPIVVRDAAGDRFASAHNQSLVDINSRYRYVVGIDQTILYLQSLPGEGP